MHNHTLSLSLGTSSEERSFFLIRVGTGGVSLPSALPSPGAHMSVCGAGRQARLLVTLCHVTAKVKEPHSRWELAVLKVRIVKENNSNNHFILMELKGP